MDNFDKLTPLEKLDDVLNFVCTQRHKSFSLSDIEHHINGKYQDSLIRTDVILMIATQLVEDKYLNYIPRKEINFSDPLPISHEEYYVTTFRGEIFNQKRGYRQQYQQNKVKLNLQRVQTFVLGLAAFLASVYYLHELFFSSETATTIIHYHIF